MARQHQIEADLQNSLAGAALYFRGIRLVFFSDADGNILHLIQRQKPLP